MKVAHRQTLYAYIVLNYPIELEIKDYQAIQSALNTKVADLAWLESVTGDDLLELTDIPAFIAMTAGKRDAWRLITSIDRPRVRAKLRNAIVDIWTDPMPILNGLREPMTLAEKIIGGEVKTTNTVSATKRDYVGELSLDLVSDIINQGGV